MIGICQPCGQEISEGQQVIYGIDRGDGKLVFGWTCCHRPVGDADVLIGSAQCLEKWMMANPQYVDELSKLFEDHKNAQH